MVLIMNMVLHTRLFYLLRLLQYTDTLGKILSFAIRSCQPVTAKTTG